MKQRKEYRIKQSGHRDGVPFFDLIVNGHKYRLAATTRDAAGREAKGRYKVIVAARAEAPSPYRRIVRPSPSSLQMAFTAYLASDTFKLYKRLTQSQRRSQINQVLNTKVQSGQRTFGESALRDWLHGPEAPDAVRYIMRTCGTKAAQANHLRKAMDQFFIWLLGEEPQAAEARLMFNIGKHASNPCLHVGKAKPKRGTDGRLRRGYTPFTAEQVDDWLHASKDDPEQNRVVRLLLMTGARLSDLILLNRLMIKQTDVGRILTYTCTKGRGSAFRQSDSIAVIPMVPELDALISEVPADRLVFIHSAHDRPYSCTEGLGNRIREWRRNCGLPEGLSAHSMRKAATHWWLRNHRDLLANNFSLKTIFGWVTDKELERYTADFDRAQEARGMLIKLAVRHKAEHG